MKRLFDPPTAAGHCSQVSPMQQSLVHEFRSHSPPPGEPQHEQPEVQLIMSHSPCGPRQRQLEVQSLHSLPSQHVYPSGQAKGGSSALTVSAVVVVVSAVVVADVEVVCGVVVVV